MSETEIDVFASLTTGEFETDVKRLELRDETYSYDVEIYNDQCGLVVTAEYFHNAPRIRSFSGSVCSGDAESYGELMTLVDELDRMEEQISPFVDADIANVPRIEEILRSADCFVGFSKVL